MYLKVVSILCFSLIACSVLSKKDREDDKYFNLNGCKLWTVQKIKVFGAFRFGPYIGLLAQLDFLKGHKPLGFPTYRGIFRVIYHGHGDPEVEEGATTTPSNDNIHELHPGLRLYYEFREISELILHGPGQEEYARPAQQQTIATTPDMLRNFDRMFSFCTRYIKVFESQWYYSDIVLLNDTDGTTAYEMQVTGDAESLTSYQVQQKIVYKDSITDVYENSTDLHLYFLFLYFPREITITAIMVVQLNRVMYTYPDNYDIAGKREYYALVYTKAEHKGKTYRIRHRMIANEKTADSQLIWKVDEKYSKFCDVLEYDVTGVVHLHSQTPLGKTKTNETKDTYFMEFSGYKHRVLRMRFVPKDPNYGGPSPNGTMDIRSIRINATTKGKWIDNKVFYDCEPDPHRWDFRRIPCNRSTDRFDYVFDQIPGVPKTTTEKIRIPIGSEEESRLNYLFLFGNIVLVIAILIVLSIGVFVVTTDRNDNLQYQ